MDQLPSLITSLFSLGDDISKVRQRLSSNIALLRLPEGKVLFEEIRKRYMLWEEFPRSMYNIDTFQMLYSHLNSLPDVFEHISRHPFRINRFYLVLLELFSRDSQEKHPTFITYLTKQTKVKLLGFLDQYGPGFVFQPFSAKYRRVFAQIYRGEDQDDPEYGFYFALTLRQTSLERIDDFLNYHQRYYRKDYLKFVRFILADDPQHETISRKQKDVCEEWLTNQSSKENKPNYLPESRVPKGWVSIPGLLKEKDIGQFFSFLYLETNGVTNGPTLLSREETEQLLAHGFAYPPEEQAVSNMFTLQVSTKLSKGLVYYMFYHLYQKHPKSDAEADYKEHFALFLKRRFTNFKDLDLKTIQNNIRNRKPVGLGREFKLEAYLG
ncbi:hypothetical protein [Lewinella sp. LCG006]|uniref:hypothetical protein n=1 Tax=Lewinella sp. LCG006 TaxID=3231911 RepID=UPI00346129C5